LIDPATEALHVWSDDARLDGDGGVDAEALDGALCESALCRRLPPGWAGGGPLPGCSPVSCVRSIAGGALTRGKVA